METLKETHVGSNTTVRHDGAEPSNTTHMPSNQCQLQFQVERTEWEALARHIQQLEDELTRVKGMLATVMESRPTVIMNQPPPEEKDEQNQPLIQNKPPEEDVEQNQLPIPTAKTSIVDLPSSPFKATKRGKPTKKKAKAAMVDLASSLSKGSREADLPKMKGRQPWWT